MLVHDIHKDTVSHVKFISYTGKYPNLCGGKLTLEIDGDTAIFGSKRHEDAQYEPFWHTSVMSPNETGEWETDVCLLPEQFRKYALEIDKVLNENMEHGCCGGCR